MQRYDFLLYVLVESMSNIYLFLSNFQLICIQGSLVLI